MSRRSRSRMLMMGTSASTPQQPARFKKSWNTNINRRACLTGTRRSLTSEASFTMRHLRREHPRATKLARSSPMHSGDWSLPGWCSAASYHGAHLHGQRGGGGLRVWWRAKFDCLRCSQPGHWHWPCSATWYSGTDGRVPPPGWGGRWQPGAQVPAARVRRTGVRAGGRAWLHGHDRYKRRAGYLRGRTWLEAVIAPGNPTQGLANRMLQLILAAGHWEVCPRVRWRGVVPEGNLEAMGTARHLGRNQAGYADGRRARQVAAQLF